MSVSWSEAEWTTRLTRVQALLAVVEEMNLAVLLLAPKGRLLRSAGEAFEVNRVKGAINNAFSGLAASCPKCKGVGRNHNCQKAQERGVPLNYVGTLTAGDER